MAELSTPQGVRLDRLGTGDVAAASALSAAIGWNQDEADWRRLVLLQPRGALAARRGYELVGTATLVTYGDSLAWLGMVIVSPAARGHGIGTALMDAALASWRPPPGATYGLDATEFGAPLYRGRGFEAVADIDRWEGVLRRPVGDRPVGAVVQSGPSSELEAADIAVRRATAADITELAALDRRETGVDRGRLLAYLITEPSTHVAIALRDDELVGHGSLRSGLAQRHVGPLVAADPAAREPLLSYLADRAAGAPVFVDALRGTGAEALFEAYGLSVVRTLQRMTRPAAKVMDAKSVIAATSFAWG